MSARDERAACVAALAAEGLNGLQIAARLGISRSYAYELLNDPSGDGVRARKDRYRRPCPQCGTLMDGSDGPSVVRHLCRDCRTWTPEACIEAVREWADEHGGVPPTVMDTRHQHGAGLLPYERTAASLFGRWNNLIRAAGYEVRRDCYPETWDAMLDAVRRGERVVDIAKRHGVSDYAIYQRFKVRGLSVRDERRRTAA